MSNSILTPPIVTALTQNEPISLTLSLLVELEDPKLPSKIGKLFKLQVKTVFELSRSFQHQFYDLQTENQRRLLLRAYSILGMQSELEWLQSKGITDFNLVMMNGYRYRHYALMEWAKRHGGHLEEIHKITRHWTIQTTFNSEITDPNLKLIDSCLHGKIETVQELLPITVRIDLALKWACIGGHLEIVKLIAEQLGNLMFGFMSRRQILQEGLVIAHQYDHSEVVTFLDTLEPDNWFIVAKAINLVLREQSSTCRKMPEACLRMQSSVENLISQFEILSQSDFPITISTQGLDVNLRTKPFEYLIEIAISNRNLELIRRCLDAGINNFDRCLSLAVSYGTLEIVQLIIERSTVSLNYEEALSAIGHPLLIDDWIFIDGIPFPRIQVNSQDQLEIARFLIGKLNSESPTNLHLIWNQIMIQVANRPKIVRLMLQHGANSYNETMVQAGQYGNVKTVKMMATQGATNFSSTLSLIFGNNIRGILKVEPNLQIVMLMLEYDFYQRKIDPNYTPINHAEYWIPRLRVGTPNDFHVQALHWIRFYHSQL